MYALAPEDKDALMELSYAHNTLGSVSMKQQEFAKAQQDFEESLRLKLLALAKAPQDSQLIADIANARSWLASAAVSLGDLNSAITINLQLQSELEAQRKLKDADGYLLDRLSIGYQRLSFLYEYQGQLSLAFDNALQGERVIQQALNLDNQNTSWKVKLYYLKLQLMLLNANIQDKRVLYTPETLDVELASESESFIKSKRYQQLKATHLKNSAYYYQILEQPKKALVYLDKAFLLLKDLIKDAPNDYKHYASLAETELLIAKQSKNINDLNSMKKYCLSAKRRLESIQKKIKTLNTYTLMQKP